MSDMSRSAIEIGPDEDETYVCDDCNGSGIGRDDLGGEWTCDGCYGRGTYS